MLLCADMSNEMIVLQEKQQHVETSTQQGHYRTHTRIAKIVEFRMTLIKDIIILLVRLRPREPRQLDHITHHSWPLLMQKMSFSYSLSGCGVGFIFSKTRLSVTVQCILKYILTQRRKNHSINWKGKPTQEF